MITAKTTTATTARIVQSGRSASVVPALPPTATFGFTDHDRTLSFDGTHFEPESGLTASEVRSGSDLSVDAQDAEGDGFTIRAGCDKRMETCGAKFANTANFRGFPHIPGQDAVLRYATKDGGHEGGVL